jgi:hypothetical protein
MDQKWYSGSQGEHLIFGLEKIVGYQGQKEYELHKKCR